MTAPHRVLLLTYEYPPVGGGTGKAVLNTARQLAKMGFEPAVLTARFRNQPREEDQGDGVRVLRVPALRRRLNQANAVEVLSYAVSVAAQRGWILRRFRPDLMLAYLTTPSTLAAAALRPPGPAPIVTLLRGQDVPGYPEPKPWMQKLAWPVTRALWRRSARVVANSEGLADLARAAAPWLRVEVARNGIDADLYRPRATPRRASVESGARPLRAIYVGRLVRHKRLRELVGAWARARPSLPAGAELLFAGFGPERAPLEAQAAALGLGASVRFLGRLDEPEVVRALQEADLFVSLSEGEGLPNAALEAMACALPSLLSDIPPHRELVEPGREGLLCDGASEEAIAAGLLRLLAGAPEERETMGEAARRAVEERFSWEAATRRLVDLFPKLD